LCSGRLSFQGRDAISMLMAVATDEPPEKADKKP
jgi:hypothetical protein